LDINKHKLKKQLEAMQIINRSQNGLRELTNRQKLEGDNIIIN